MSDTHDDGDIAGDGAASPSRRRFLGQMGAAGIAGMAVPLLGKTAASATATSRSTSALAVPPYNPLAGATVFPSSSQNQATALQAWSGLVYPIGIGKVYFPKQTYPTPPPLDSTVTAYSTYAKPGAQVVLCYKPRYGSDVTTAQLDEDLQSMVNSITALKNTGATVAAVTIWNEPDTQSPPVPAYQYKRLYQNDYATLHTLAPVICAFSGENTGNATSYFPAGFSDGIEVDYYGHNYLKGNFLSNWTTVAKNNGVAFGVLESGDTSGGEAKLDQQDFAMYLTSVGLPPMYPGDKVNSIQAVLNGWVADGGSLLGYAWWQDNSNPTGVNIISDPSDFRITYLRLLQESL